jgi:hypothetical protein
LLLKGIIFVKKKNKELDMIQRRTQSVAPLQANTTLLCGNVWQCGTHAALLADGQNRLFTQRTKTESLDIAKRIGISTMAWIMH